MHALFLCIIIIVTDYGEVVLKFGLKVKFEREKKGLSQSELAEIAGLNTNSIGKIERAEVTPGLKTIHAIANALQVLVEELVNPKKIDL